MGLGTRSELAVPSERSRLVEAMARSCAERGYGETTVEQVASEAGLDREVFERTFADKEECGVAAVESILGETMAALSAAYSADTSEWESALQALRGMLELFAARPALAHMAFTGSRQMMPAAAFASYESGFSILNAMLNRLRANQAGEAEPPVRAARAAIGGGEALVRRELAAGRAEDLPRVLPDLVYGATVPFLGQEEALALARRAREIVAESRWG